MVSVDRCRQLHTEDEYKREGKALGRKESETVGRSDRKPVSRRIGEVVAS